MEYNAFLVPLFYKKSTPAMNYNIMGLIQKGSLTLQNQ